jgi:sensor histidine kinase YesM
MATKQMNITTKLFGPRDRINDIGIRVVLVPLFGIAIPLITRMVPHEQFSHWLIKFSYIYTILIAFVVYEGVRFLHLTLRTYFDWVNSPVKKLLAFIITVPFYCVPVSTLMLVGWYHIFMQGKIDWDVIRLSVIIILVAVFFLVNLYETVFLVRDVANEKLAQEQLQRARVEAELEALKSQIDPHFIFNSLNTLGYLIEQQPAKAGLFNSNMADVYRYILQNKARRLVLLREEITFLQDYFSLLTIRFEKAVQLTVLIERTEWDNLLLPPISLQLLVENAVKHNEFSEAKPLFITVELKDEILIVQNDIRKKSAWRPSNKIGLLNLKERYRLTTGKEILIEESGQRFIVKMPVLRVHETNTFTES